MSLLNCTCHLPQVHGHLEKDCPYFGMNALEAAIKEQIIIEVNQEHARLMAAFKQAGWTEAQIESAYLRGDLPMAEEVLEVHLPSIEPKAPNLMDDLARVPIYDLKQNGINFNPMEAMVLMIALTDVEDEEVYMRYFEDFIKLAETHPSSDLTSPLIGVYMFYFYSDTNKVSEDWNKAIALLKKSYNFPRLLHDVAVSAICGEVTMRVQEMRNDLVNKWNFLQPRENES